MKSLVLKYWDRLRSSFWFIPTLMAGGAVALAFTTVALDEMQAVNDWLESQGWAYAGGAEGASVMLGTIASSMITIAGVVFSMTLVALSLASSQLGPRLLRIFMRDKSNQMVLGTFIATFVYCLLVLRTIRRADEVAFVPHLSVTFGVFFALGSLGVLIYFIHHVSVSIQADEVIARVGKELIQGIDRLFPQDLNGPVGPSAGVASSAVLPDEFDREARPVASGGDGYLQYIDADALMKLVTEQNLLLRLEKRPGQYVAMGCPLLTVWPGDRATRELEEAVNAIFILGDQRTAAQDLEFAILQLVEIAVRALSPGINDPFTAISCVDRLGSALRRLAQRQIPSPNRYDDQGQLRVIAPGFTFEAAVDVAFGQIRHHARSSAAVTIRLLETIAVVADVTRQPPDRSVLQRHAEMIARGAREALPEPWDRQVVEERYLAVMRPLGRIR